MTQGKHILTHSLVKGTKPNQTKQATHSGNEPVKYIPTSSLFKHTTYLPGLVSVCWSLFFLFLFRRRPRRRLLLSFSGVTMATPKIIITYKHCSQCTSELDCDSSPGPNGGGGDDDQANHDRRKVGDFVFSFRLFARARPLHVHGSF